MRMGLRMNGGETKKKKKREFNLHRDRDKTIITTTGVTFISSSSIHFSNRYMENVGKFS